MCFPVQANLDEQQTTSNVFVRALMTSICQSAIICEFTMYSRHLTVAVLQILIL